LTIDKVGEDTNDKKILAAPTLGVTTLEISSRILTH